MIQTTLDDFLPFHEVNLTPIINATINKNARSSSSMASIQKPNIRTIDTWALQFLAYTQPIPFQLNPFFTRISILDVNATLNELYSAFETNSIEQFLPLLTLQYPETCTVQVKAELHKKCAIALVQQGKKSTAVEYIRNKVTEDESIASCLREFVAMLALDQIQPKSSQCLSDEELLALISYEYSASKLEHAQLKTFFVFIGREKPIIDLIGLVKKHLETRGYILSHTDHKSAVLNLLVRKFTADNTFKSQLECLHEIATIINEVPDFARTRESFPTNCKRLLVEIGFLWCLHLKDVTKCLAILRESKDLRFAGAFVLPDLYLNEKYLNGLKMRMISYIPQILSLVLHTMHVEETELERAISNPDNVTSAKNSCPFRKALKTNYHLTPFNGIMVDDIETMSVESAESLSSSISQSPIDSTSSVESFDTAVQPERENVASEEVIEILCELLSIDREEAVDLLSRHGNLLSNVLNSIF